MDLDISYDNSGSDVYRTTVTEEEIRDAFTKNGFTVKAFKFFPKDRKMALIQMPSMDDAVAALIVSTLT